MDKQKKQKTQQGGVNRREFMKKSAIAVGTVMTSGLTLNGAVKNASAAKRDHILIGRPNPGTGPLASFGVGRPG